ncbi:hypothetical protein Tco_1260361 [Tanacetum coccineum]
MRDEGTKIQKGPTGLTLQTQTTPSPSLAFVKESIDILRTMIKELDHQAKAKTTPRKVIYVDSEKEALNRLPEMKSDSLGFSGTGSLPSGCVDLTSDEEPTDEDGDIGMGDSIGVSTSLGGEIFSGGKKCRESNIGDGDNTGDRGKIVGGAIEACGEIGERASEAKRSLVNSSKNLEEVFPSKAGK